MASVVRFEVWTRPDTGTFTRKFPLTDVTNYTLRFGMFGNGKIIIPDDHPRLDDILFVDSADHSNDVGTLIRAYVGTVHLTDFYASRMAISFGDMGKRTATITGGNLGSALGRTRLRQFDWATGAESDIVEPDWQYGVGKRFIGNPSFEESSDFNPALNGGKYDQLIGFEDENNAGWIGEPGSDFFEQVFTDPTVDNGDALTGSFSLVWTPQDLTGKTTSQSAISKVVRIAGSERYQFTLNLKTPTTGRRFIFGASNVVTAHHTNGFISNGIGWAELDNAAEGTGSTDGTWQQIDLDVTFDVFTNYANITLYVAYTDTLAGPITRIDDVSLAGYNLGLYSWEPTSFTLVTLFDRDLSPPTAARDGAAAANITTTAANHGIGIPISVEAGKTYTFQAYIHHDIGSDQTFTARIVRTAGGSVIASANTVVSTGGTWTLIEATGEIDVDAVFVQILKVTSGTFWIDDCALMEGFASATVGEIVGDIYDDAATDHSGDNRTALSWVVENYTDAADADSVTWDQDISLRLKRGSTYRRIIEQLVGFGYEFDMRPDPADDTIIELSAYNPDGLGADLTTGDGGAITSGFVAAGPLIRREPAATYVMVEGEDLEWADTRNTVLETPWGEIEAYSGSKDNLIDDLDVRAAAELADVGLEELRVTLQAPSLVPGVDYNIGDIVRVTPGSIPTARYRVVAITVKYADPEPLWQVSYAAV